MKTCSYCGKEHPDDATVCSIDGYPLEEVVPTTSPPSSPGIQTISKRLVYIGPLRAGIVCAIVYGCLSLVFVPFVLLASLLGHKAGDTAGFGEAILPIFMPVFYTVGGFIVGIISAALYNLAAKWTGGLEFRVTA